MIINSNFIILLFLFYSTCLFSQTVEIQKKDSIQYSKINETLEFGFKKPKTWEMFKYIPNDVVGFGKFVIQKENLKWDALALGATVALIPYDSKIINDASELGQKIGGWDATSHYKRVLGIEIVPTSVSSGVYYLGNGNTPLLLSGMFYAIGKIRKDDYRDLNTSNELIELLLSIGVVTQTLKRMTGRQSPVTAIESGVEGGKWRPFPSFSAYQQSTPNYDAMPSGHIATYMATVIVIATNYQEIKWIKPVGYSLGGLLAFSMLSQKVHWVSDYPIGILIGYVMGKNIANRRIIRKETNTNLGFNKTHYKINYSFRSDKNYNIIGASITF